MSDVSATDLRHLRGWTVPALDAVNHDWFTSGALTLQQCAACGVVQHPPEELCHACGSMSFASRLAAPTGTVHSHTVVHHSVHSALDEVVPYTVVLVALDDVPHVRVVGNLLDADEVAIGMPVVATWEELATEDGTVVLLPQWRPASKGERP